MDNSGVTIKNPETAFYSFRKNPKESQQPLAIRSLTTEEQLASFHLLQVFHLRLFRIVSLFFQALISVPLRSISSYFLGN